MPIHLITGAVSSGKSAQALVLARQYSPRRIFIATGEPLDDEMAAQIALHKEERGRDFETVEEPLRLSHALRSTGHCSVVLVDSLSIWISNCLLKKGEDYYVQEQQDLLNFLLERVLEGPDIVFVSDEVGWGGVSVDRLTRKFQRLLGGLNQHVAAMSDRVVLAACGYPLMLKGKGF